MFGVRRKGDRLAAVFAMCGACQSPASQVVLRVHNCFALFFVPVIPLGRRYRTSCALCGDSVDVSAEQADRLMAMGELQNGGEPVADVRVATPAGPLPDPYAPPA